MPKIRSSVNNQKKRPALALQGPPLTVILAPEEQTICAFCPELDLIAEQPTEAEALEDLLKAMQDYAEEYREDYALYSQSPNRAHHWPYVQAIACDDWKLKQLLNIRYGVLQV